MTTVRENDDSTTRWYFVAVIILFAVISVPMAAMGAVAVWKGDSGAATVRTTTVDVELSEFAVSGSLAAAPGDVSLTITNKGTVAHNHHDERAAHGIDPARCDYDTRVRQVGCGDVRVLLRRARPRGFGNASHTVGQQRRGDYRA